MPMSSHLQFAWDARKSSLTILRRLTAEPWEKGARVPPPPQIDSTRTFQATAKYNDINHV